MSELNEAQAAAKAKMSGQNPAQAPGKTVGERKRIPLSVPQRKLEVPDIPGYHLRWFRGTKQRINQALQAGYMFVTPDEVQLNNVAIGGDAAKAGNAAMDDKVSVIEGGDTEGGQAVHMILMKQSLAHKREDDRILQDRNDSIADTLTANFRQGTVAAGAQGELPVDVQNRYVDRSRTKIPDMFKRKLGRSG